MDSTIYRKYRPTKFGDVLGQDHIKAILISQITKDKLSHAYLFCGPRGTGKTSMARIMAKAVNCLKWEESNDVCNECANCEAINNETSMDFIEIDAASNRGIDEVRKLKEGINFLPTSLKKKVYVIDEVHMMTKDAFNSLLKTLEEPPSHILFILATTEPHKLPDTILSRVQRFDFKLADIKTLSQKLQNIAAEQKVNVKNEIISLIYNISGGSFRDAESLFSKIITEVEGDNIELQDIANLIGIAPEDKINLIIHSAVNANPVNIIEAIDELRATGVDTMLLVNQLLQSLQHDLAAKLSVNEDYLKEVKLMDIVSSKYQEIKYAHDPYLVLKLVLVLACTQTQNSSSFVINQNPPVSSNLMKDLKPEKAETPKTSEISGGQKLDFLPVIEEVAKKNSRSAMLLRTSKLIEFTTNTLKLATGYEFYSQIMKKSKFQQLVIESARNVYPSIQINVYSCDYDKSVKVMEENIQTSEVREDTNLKTETSEQVVVVEQVEEPDDFLVDDEIPLVNTSNKDLVENIF